MPDPEGQITVVLPCLNEEESLPAVLAAIPAGYQALVVDNNSTDDTAGVAGRHGAQVVAEPRAGYGSAVHAGVLAATTPIVAVIDADGSMDGAELPRLVAELDRGGVVGAVVVDHQRSVAGGDAGEHARQRLLLVEAGQDHRDQAVGVGHAQNPRWGWGSWGNTGCECVGGTVCWVWVGTGAWVVGIGACVVALVLGGEYVLVGGSYVVLGGEYVVVGGV